MYDCTTSKLKQIFLMKHVRNTEILRDVELKLISKKRRTAEEAAENFACEPSLEKRRASKRKEKRKL